MITNNWIDDITDQTNQLMSEFLSRYFDIVLQSCQLGIRKPHPLIYRLACHRLAVEPSQVMYIMLDSVSKLDLKAFIILYN